MLKRVFLSFLIILTAIQSVLASSYTVTSTRDYIGPHVFENGELIYSGFDGGYFEPGSGARYYIADWQGNVARVVGRDGKVLQSTTYYPYGEPTIEPAGQPWLYGGKERIHAGGRNAYDFGARHLIGPTGNWSSTDPKATKFFPISPFSYCAGDPINHVDRDGMETQCFVSDSTMNRFSMNYPNDDFMNIVTHGNTKELIYRLEDENYRIRTANELITEINSHFNTAYGKVENLEYVKIKLFACRTGQNIEDEEPISQIISSGFRNAIIYAPNDRIALNSDGTFEGVNKLDIVWRIFFRGTEIKESDIKDVKLQLFREKYFSRQNTKVRNKLLKACKFLK